MKSEDDKGVMKEGLKKLYSGDFNHKQTHVLADGTVIITLVKEGENKTYRFKVRDLYGEHEEVLEHEVIKHKVPKHIEARMKEAKKR